MNQSGTTLDQIRSMMRDRGAHRLLAKVLSKNDNSKHQIYLGGDFGVLHIIPAGEPVAGTSGKKGYPIFKAPLILTWLDDEGRSFPASHAQLILYPQYPEVRMSGFLMGTGFAPRVLNGKGEGRVLLLGIAAEGRLFAYAADATSAVANELRADTTANTVGVFQEVSLDVSHAAGDSRERLLEQLCRISKAGWIDGWRLSSDGSSRPCTAPNCVGVTLESELGITANGRAEPDFEGWEVKSHTVANFLTSGSGAVTLMTPEPTGGFYLDEGVIAFVRRFGYQDKRGRDDRHNFGGIHRVGQACSATGLSLELHGYDHPSHQITRSDGVLALVDSTGFVAASWSFARLLSHWSRKHARAVFVPALKRTVPSIAFRYSSNVFLAEGTDYLRVLDALSDGTVYYDPGIKIENSSTPKPKPKKRSQFRVSRSNLARLYHSGEHRDSCTGATGGDTGKSFHQPDA